MPKEERETIRATSFISGVLFRQSNISRGNLKTLRGYLTSTLPGLPEMAQLALEIAQVKPHKRKRYRYLKAKRPQLLARLHQLFPGEVYDPATDGLYLDECDESTVELWDAEKSIAPARRPVGISCAGFAGAPECSHPYG